MVRREGAEPLSLYFHIPFCKRKCPYCHFYSVVDNEALKERFLYAVCCEIERWAENIQGREIVSVYFGGGTPFLLGPQKTEIILNKLSAFCLADTCEISIETNPETTNKKDLLHFNAIGVNRLSIGAQSFTKEHLKTLQRGHTPECILQVIGQSIESGFSNISIDLMYDLPGLTLDTWKQTLKEACSLPIQHLSLYNLILEPKTPWFRRKTEIEALMPDEEISMQMYLAAHEITESHGFHQYEISAFAKNGFSSLHNIGYWNGREFLGFGPSAFSFFNLETGVGPKQKVPDFDSKSGTFCLDPTAVSRFNAQRFSNISNIHSYIDAQEKGVSAIDYVDDAAPEKRLREMISIGLRMNNGICLASLEKIFGTADEDLIRTLKNLESLSLLERKGSFLSLTDEGRLVYDAIAVELI
jgi:oxygen-independent coproporphyrinogen-3 oxidase